MQSFFVYPNGLVLLSVMIWSLSVGIIYRHSPERELNRKGLHFEIAAIAVLFMIYLNYSLSDNKVAEEFLIVIPIVIGRFFIASEIVHFRRR